MKKQSGFIQTSILIAIIAGVLVLGGGGYIGIKQYQNYRFEKTEKIEKDTLSEKRRQVEEEQQKKLQELVDSQSKELEKQKKEIEIIKKKPSVIIQNIEKSPAQSTPKEAPTSLSDLIEHWSPSVAKITCISDIDKANFKTDVKGFLTRNRVGVRPVTVSGSGFLISMNTQFGPGTIAIVTNRHVLNTHNGFGVPYSCEAILPDGHKYIFDIDDVQFVTGEEEFGYKDEIEYFDGKPYLIYNIDAGWLRIKNPDTYTRNLAEAKSYLTCKEIPRIGEEIVILGYPSIGSSQGITATDGIISGLEEFYFVTSAKVEHGNSGGASIWRDKNCYLGIPSFARTGGVESLARILSFKKIFK